MSSIYKRPMQCSEYSSVKKHNTRRELGRFMYAKKLEHVLYLLCQGIEVSHTFADEITERFNALRGYGQLPRGRERRAQLLRSKEIAAAVFGLVSVRPGWAGHGAIILAGLHPVGGTDASFENAPTLSDAVVRLLDDKTARKRFIRLRVTIGETGTNSNGAATLTYERDGERQGAYFVPKEAVSLLQPGRDLDFDFEQMHNPAGREMSFGRAFFERLARECELAKRFPAPPEGDGAEYDAEEARQRRYQKLGVQRNSRFLNIGVDNQVTWPKEEQLIKFDRYTLVLMPKTKENVQSVHIDLHANRLNDEDAMTIINRFLSVMTWCDDQFAIAQFGWSGNPVPVPVSKRDLAFHTASSYIFDRKIQSSEEALRALALYREARNAQQNGFISYAVLNYYKIIEIKHPTKNGPKFWFRDNLPRVSEGNYKEEIERFKTLCGNAPPHEYIYSSCRIAVAHASDKSKSDPDNAHEIRRLHTAADVMQLLARRFIETEFAISDLIYSGD